jgi:hypothetical protein
MISPDDSTFQIDGEWLRLMRAALARGECFRCRLSGNSMSPTLPESCQVEIASLPVQVRLGDLVVFLSRDQLVAHRLVDRRHGRWITQGDGRRAPDRPLDPSQALGTVAAAYDEAGRRCWPGVLPRFQAFLWVARYHAFRVARTIRERLSG